MPLGNLQQGLQGRSMSRGGGLLFIIMADPPPSMGLCRDKAEAKEGGCSLVQEGLTHSSGLGPVAQPGSRFGQ